MANYLSGPYAPIIRRQAPYARQRYFEDMGIQQQRNALAQNASQYNRQMELQRQMAEDEAEQARQANLMSAAGTAVSAYPYLKSGAKSLYSLGEAGYNALAGPSASAVAPSAASSAPSLAASLGPESGAAGYDAGVAASRIAPIASESAPLFAEGASSVASLGPESGAAGYGGYAGYGAGGATAGETAGTAAGGATAGETAGTAAGGGLSWWGGPVIAGVSIGQMAAADNAKPTEGVPSGHFFSQNESGNWRPRLSEPDKNLVSQMWGGGSTTGAKFDARLQKGDWQGGLRALPGFVHGYAIPGLDVAGNVGRGWATRQFGDRVGNEVGFAIDPIGQTTGALADSGNIGEAATALLTGGRGDSLGDVALSLATGGIVGGDK